MKATLSMRRSCLVACAVALAMATMLAAIPRTALSQTGAAIGSQSTSVQGVTVKATPKSMGLDNPRWEFTLVLDTHSGDLSDDLMATATLITGDGRQFKPVAWIGAAPGGHHREGALEFAVPAPWPSAVELRLERNGEAAPRSFRWQF